MCLIEHGSFRMIVMDAPSESNSDLYLKALKALGVTDVVRTCEPTYSAERFLREGLRVHEMAFPDGAAPPERLLGEWTELVRLRCPARAKNAGLVAVHCVAGLGRAPVMAAVALIEVTGMDPLDAVEAVRARQRGAINARQLQFLRSYKPRRRKGGVGPCTCALM